MTTTPPNRRGYVLLMSLVVLCLVSLLLAGLARHSLELAVQTHDAHEQLQRRWGCCTLRWTLQQRAPMIYQLHSDSELADPLARAFPIRETFQLADVTYRVRIEDENTKVNLNRLFAMDGKEKTLQTISAFSPVGVRIQLRPSVSSESSYRGLAFESWGEVFDFSRWRDREPMQQMVGPYAPALTLWGNGRLHVCFTSEDTLVRFFAGRLEPRALERLVQARLEWHPEEELTVSALVQSIPLKPKERSVLLQWLTDRSTTFSVLIEVDDGTRHWRQLSVAAPNLPAPATFEW